MRIFHGTFLLEPGIGIFLPSGNLIRRPSNNADVHPGTPHFFLLSSPDKSGRRHFKDALARHSNKRENDVTPSGFHLFVPIGSKPGDLLVVEWVQATCACARLATAAELEATKPQAQPAGAW